MPAWPHENLRNLERSRSLLPEPTSASEITRHLKAAASYLTDSTNTANSLAGRYMMAYAAAHSLALVALRANDMRTAQEKGHRRLVFDLLPVTCGSEKGDALALHRAHEKRNTIEYAGDAALSERETEDLIGVVRRVQSNVRKWIERNRPELVK